MEYENEITIRTVWRKFVNHGCSVPVTAADCRWGIDMLRTCRAPTDVIHRCLRGGERTGASPGVLCTTHDSPQIPFLVCLCQIDMYDESMEDAVALLRAACEIAPHPRIAPLLICSQCSDTVLRCLCRFRTHPNAQQRWVFLQVLLEYTAGLEHNTKTNGATGEETALLCACRWQRNHPYALDVVRALYERSGVDPCRRLPLMHAACTFQYHRYQRDLPQWDIIDYLWRQQAHVPPDEWMFDRTNGCSVLHSMLADPCGIFRYAPADTPTDDTTTTTHTSLFVRIVDRLLSVMTDEHLQRRAADGLSLLDVVRSVQPSPLTCAVLDRLVHRFHTCDVLCALCSMSIPYDWTESQAQTAVDWMRMTLRHPHFESLVLAPNPRSFTDERDGENKTGAVLHSFARSNRPIAFFDSGLLARLLRCFSRTDRWMDPDTGTMAPVGDVGNPFVRMLHSALNDKSKWAERRMRCHVLDAWMRSTRDPSHDLLLRLHALPHGDLHGWIGAGDYTQLYERLWLHKHAVRRALYYLLLLTGPLKDATTTGRGGPDKDEVDAADDDEHDNNTSQRYFFASWSSASPAWSCLLGFLLSDDDSGASFCVPDGYACVLLEVTDVVRRGFLSASASSSSPACSSSLVADAAPDGVETTIGTLRSDNWADFFRPLSCTYQVLVGAVWGRRRQRPPSNATRTRKRPRS